MCKMELDSDSGCVCIPTEILAELHHLLEEKDGITYNIMQNYSTLIHHNVWFTGNMDDAELMIRLDMRGRFWFRRIQVAHKHTGVLTAVFKYIIEHREELGVRQIIVEAVSTKSMNNWCAKYGFTPSPSNICNEEDGCSYGDWYYNLI